MPFKFLRRLTFISFLLLIVSLAYNQLTQGSYYLQLSQNNRIKLIRLAAARGLIYDRASRVLAGRRLVFNVALLPQEIKDAHQALDKISPILGIPKEDLLRQFRKNFSTPLTSIVVARDVSKKTAIALECRESDIPGVVIQTEPLRDYQYGVSLCHILGYLGKITEGELSRGKVYGLRIKDLVGRSGIEEKFDHYLRGQAGGMQVEVNSQGFKVRVLGSRVPQAGKDLCLTVDVELQKFVDSLLEGKKGACIVMDPQNGEILTMVSEPGFDPNLFIKALSQNPRVARRIEKLLDSKEAPLLNRAISGAYPPGSIFKVVVAAAALETGKITPQDILDCPGRLLVGNREFFCWNLDGHGRQNLSEAIAHSCNVFFYKLGLALGPDRLSEFARKFKLNSATGIDLPYESVGLVPSKTWKLKAKREKWYDGDTANFSIGQGYLLATPLQIAQMISIVVNGGYLIQPHIVKKIGEQESNALRKKLAFKKETLEIIKEGMRQAIQSEEGTAQRANIPGVQWAAKTGTAQTSYGLSHGWFGGFYPFSKPRFLVLVFLEYGGSGAEIPASIAKRIIEYIREKDLGDKREVITTKSF